MTATSNPRSSVFQAAKVAVETTAGTAPSSGYKKLTALGFSPTINPTVKTFRPAGQKYTTVTALNREDSTWSLDGLPTFTEIIYPLSSVLTEAEKTAAGGTTSAASGSRVMGADGTHWFFKPSATDADSPVSFTVYKGGIGGAERATFLRVGDLTLTFNRNDSSISGSAMARALEADQHMPGNEVQQIAVNANGGTFTITYSGQTTAALAYNISEALLLAALEGLSNIPTGALRVTQTVAASPAFTYQIEFGAGLGETDITTMTTDALSLTGGASTATVTTVTAGAAISAVALVPVLPTQISVYAFSSAQASISDTTNETSTYRLSDVMEITLPITGRYAEYWTLDASQSSFNAMIEAAPTLQFTTKMQANSAGFAYLNTLRSGGTVYFRIKAVGAVISSVEHYEMTIDLAGKVTAASEIADSDGVYAVTWTWDAVPTLANGGPIEIAVVNNITAL